MSPNELPILPFASQVEFADWLAENHDKSDGLWLKFVKKSTNAPSVTYDEAVETALCYGWIDSQKKGFDESFWIQRFTPRKPRSIWSRDNREKAEGLIASGQMQPAGLAAVEQAKQNGRWEAAYDSQGTITVPDDLQAELGQNPKAKAFFDTLDSANRYAILFKLQTARKAETRARRLRQFVEMLEWGEKIHP